MKSFFIGLLQKITMRNTGAYSTIPFWRTPWFYLTVVFTLFWAYRVIPPLYPNAPFIERMRLHVFHVVPGLPVGDTAIARTVLLPIITILVLILLWQIRLSRPMTARMALFGSALLVLPFFFAPPLASGDVYAYGYYGRLVAVHGENPYTVREDAQIRDVYLDATYAKHPFQTNYGPLWTSIEADIMRVAGSLLHLGVFLFRSIAVLSFLASVALLWLMLPENYRDRRLLLFAWNPYVLFEVGNNAHNDMFMMAWALLAVFAFQRKWYIVSFLSLIIATLVKFVPLFLLPIVFLIMLRGKPKQKMLLHAGIGAAIVALFTVIAFLPFWSGLETFRLIAMLGATFSLPVYHPMLLLAWLFQVTIIPNPATAATVVHAIGIVGFAITLFWIARIAWRSFGKELPTAALLYFSGFLVFAMSFYQPWYLLWVIPLVPLWRNAKAVLVLISLSILGSLTYAIF